VQGFPDYPHGLGHPISGFLAPILSQKTMDVEHIGGVHTVEPGIYIPGTRGARFEENVVITSEGYEQSTLSPRIY